MTNTPSIEQMIEEAAVKEASAYPDQSIKDALEVFFRYGAQFALANLDKHPDVIKLVHHLTEVCKPEPDGFGDFVADDFTQVEILNARQALAEFNTKYLKTEEK